MPEYPQLQGVEDLIGKKPLRPARIPLRFDTPDNRSTSKIREHLQPGQLKTVCEEATCPNLHHCWSSGTATFLILGRLCTRNCRFCDISTGKPDAPDPGEPTNVAIAARDMKLNHIVITSVTRDDLPDGGASHFARTVQEIRKLCHPSSTIEVLIPDLSGSRSSLETVVKSGVDILNHNIETVPSLYAKIRPGAKFERSIELLRQAGEMGAVTKSGIMLGMGETFDEVVNVFHELRRVGVSIVTIGQYLSPSKNHAPVIDWISPDMFELYRNKALELGFDHVESGNLVRSSYHAAEGARRTVKN